MSPMFCIRAYSNCSFLRWLPAVSVSVISPASVFSASVVSVSRSLMSARARSMARSMSIWREVSDDVRVVERRGKLRFSNLRIRFPVVLAASNLRFLFAEGEKDVADVMRICED